MGSDKGSPCTENAIAVPVGGPPNDLTSTHAPTFGTPVAGVTYEQRCAAYAVIRNDVGTVAAVHVPAGYGLRGGGMLPQEAPEEAVLREVREELGGTLRVGRPTRMKRRWVRRRATCRRAISSRGKATQGVGNAARGLGGNTVASCAR